LDAVIGKEILLIAGIVCHVNRIVGLPGWGNQYYWKTKSWI